MNNHIELRDQAFGTMLIVALVLSPVSMIIGWFTYKYLLINYQFVSASSVMAVYLLIFIMGISQLMTQVMYAEHKAFWPNIYPAFAPMWTLAVLLIFKNYGIDNFNVLLLIIGIANLLMPIHAARHLNVLKRSKFSLKIAKQQITESKDQLLFAAMAAITLSIDYIVMSRTLAAQDIVHYNLASRIYMTLLVVHGVLLSTNWTPVSDLVHASKYKEARIRVEKVLKQGLYIGGGAGLLILAGIDPLVNALTSGKVDHISLSLCIAFWIYALLRIWTDTYAMAIQSSGMVSEINKFIPMQASLSAVSQYILGTNFGALGVVVGLMISFALTASWIIPRKFYYSTGN